MTNSWKFKLNEVSTANDAKEVEPMQCELHLKQNGLHPTSPMQW